MPVRGYSAGLGLLLEPLRGAPEQVLAHLVDDRPAHEQPEHAAGIDLEPVGRARAPAVERLEPPPAGQRLDVAPLLDPVDGDRGLVAEAHARADAADLGVVDGLDQRRPAVAVALEHGDLHQRALPRGRALDVGRDVEAPRHRRLDLDRPLAPDRPHGRAPYPRARRRAATRSGRPRARPTRRSSRRTAPRARAAGRAARARPARRGRRRAARPPRRRRRSVSPTRPARRTAPASRGRPRDGRRARWCSRSEAGV